MTKFRARLPPDQGQHAANTQQGAVLGRHNKLATEDAWQMLVATEDAWQMLVASCLCGS